MVMLDVKKYDGPALTSKGLSTDQLLNVAQPHHTRHFVANIQINICDLSNMRLMMTDDDWIDDDWW